MSGGDFRLRLHGTRGSLPVSGPDFCTYGGNTICIEIRCAGRVLLFDAGTGLAPAGMALKAEGPRHLNLFFSHAHYDHILGLPYFAPLYDPDFAVTFWSGHQAGSMTTEDMLCGFMRPPWFPVTPKAFRARVAFRDFIPGEVLAPWPEVGLRTASLNHPGGAVGYRVEAAGRSVAIVTDTEHEPGILDPAVLELIEDVDLFLYDASHAEDEMTEKRGFGHSTWQQGLRLARAAGARRVGFIHHAPWRRDLALAEIDRLAAAEFPGAFCARDGQVVEL